MKANELRIGNLITRKNKVLKVWRIQPDKILVSGYSCDKYFKCEEIEPILLTEEWLLKFGFEKKYGIYNPSYNLEIQKTDFYLRNCFLGGFYWGFNISKCNDCELCDVMPLQYVHSLQNLYFALTGVELIQQ